MSNTDFITVFFESFESDKKSKSKNQKMANLKKLKKKILVNLVDQLNHLDWFLDGGTVVVGRIPF